MKTFILLASISDEHNERKLCESIESSVYETVSEMEKSVWEHFGGEYVGISEISDFMDDFNNEDIEQSLYFMSYVFVK